MSRVPPQLAARRLPNLPSSLGGMCSLPLAASALVVNAIVFNGRTLWVAIPDGNMARGLRLEHGVSDRFSDQLRDTATRARRGRAQRVEFFLPEVNLRHICVTLAKPRHTQDKHFRPPAAVRHHLPHASAYQFTFHVNSPAVGLVCRIMVFQ